MREEPAQNPYAAPQVPHLRGWSGEDPPFPVAKMSSELYTRLLDERKITISPSELETGSVLVAGQEIGVGILEEPDMALIMGKIIELSHSAITIERIDTWSVVEKFAPNVIQ